MRLLTVFKIERINATSVDQVYMRCSIPGAETVATDELTQFVSFHSWMAVSAACTVLFDVQPGLASGMRFNILHI